MLKETFGVLGAAVLGSSLLGAPATGATAQSSVSAMGVAAAPTARLDDLEVRISVTPRKSAFISVTVTDDDEDPVEDLRVCLDRRVKKGNFVEVGCKETRENGRVFFVAPLERTYQIRIPRYKNFKKFKSSPFSGSVRRVLTEDT